MTLSASNRADNSPYSSPCLCSKNMVQYLKDIHGFEDSNITVMLDASGYPQPTYDNILAAYRTLTQQSKAGDAVFCHYSGHGGKIRDDDGDEKDGYDETLVPVDYEAKGQLRDDDIFSTLVGPMPAGVVLTCVMDCCHSGTVLDLPFVFLADGVRDVHVGCFRDRTSMSLFTHDFSLNICFGIDNSCILLLFDLLLPRIIRNMSRCRCQRTSILPNCKTSLNTSWPCRPLAAVTLSQ
jgi:Caspase domain